MAEYDINLFDVGVDFFDVGATPEVRVFGVNITPSVPAGGGAGATYRMRGFDQNGAVNDFVFWDSAEVDSDASDYSGSAGPVVDIVVHRVLGL